jgi:MFS family permease
MRSYREILTIPGALKFSAAGFLARAGGAMVGLGIVLMVSALYGSYGLAGLVSASNGLGWAVGTAFLSNFVDRFGQRRVMYPAMFVSVAALGLLVVFAVMRLPAWTLFGPAVLTGLAAGAPGALVRTRWNHVTSDPRQLHTAYALESTLDELTFVVGPLVVTALSTAVNPVAALVAPMVITLVGSYLFYGQRASEPPLSERSEHRKRGLSQLVPLIPGVGPVVLLNLLMGCAFGAMNVSVVAATSAWGVRQATGYVLGMFSVASGISGFWYGTRAWASRIHVRLVGGVVALALFSSGLLLTHSVLALIGVGVLFGATVAPTFINGNSVVARIVPRHRLTEGLAWMGTGVGVGVSIGLSVSGQLIDRVGYAGGFVSVVGFAVGAAIIALIGLPVVRRALAVEAAGAAPQPVADVG